MKRAKNIYAKIVSESNLMLAIEEVNASHRWTHGHKPNRTVLWVETTKQERVAELRRIIEDGFQPAPLHKRRIYDHAAGKWRDICEPKLYPDQYIHHAVVHALIPEMMRCMDKWCCGSIRKRGIHYGQRALKKWMKYDRKGTKYALEMDIHHFYDSIQPSYVMDRMRELFKDGRALTLVETLVRDGIPIGCYFSQWFANTLLQPLDRLIRESGLCAHYLRYMDNFTIYGPNKRHLRKLFQLIEQWLNAHGLQVKANWQIYRVTARRLPNALGYRYGRGYTFLRKTTLLRIRRKLREAYRLIDRRMQLPYKLVHGMMSRLGQLKHCNSKQLRARIIRQNFVKMLKNIIRNHRRKELMEWNTALQRYTERRFSAGVPA